MHSLLRSVAPLRAGARLLVALLFTLAPAAGFATVVRAATLEQLAAQTPVIVRARVGQQQARWDDGRSRIHTFTEVLVTEALKGDVPKSLMVRQPGGVVDELGQHVDGAARFTQGEDVVLFLEAPADDASVFVVSGLASGKVKLETTALGEVRARRDLRGIAFYAPGNDQAPVVRDVNNDEDLGTAEQFLTRIRRAIKVAAAKSGGR